MPEIKKKRCSDCKKVFPVSGFHRNTTRSGGYNGVCKVCKNKRAKKYNQTSEGKESTRKGLYKFKYGITLQDYDDMFEAQKGVCAICGKPESCTFKDVIKRLSVDHDHSTGKIRGLLCDKCNRLLGNANDDTGVLVCAILYLRKAKDS